MKITIELITDTERGMRKLDTSIDEPADPMVILGMLHSATNDFYNLSIKNGREQAIKLGLDLIGQSPEISSEPTKD